MRFSDLPTNDQVRAQTLEDPAFREQWERTALARAVATRLVEYRAEHHLTQTALARQLRMQQSAIARLEAGDHTPSIDTLQRLSRLLGVTFHIDITPAEVRLSA
jgi:ribosome-binding protein aMBF1 (putative translation factor)